MTKIVDNFRSPLSKVKGHGSAHNGTGHYIAQRVSAIFLVFLGVWFVYLLASIANASKEDWIDIIASPVNVILLCTFFISSLYHGMLGIQTIVEDYVHCNCAKFWLIIITKFVVLTTTIGIVFSILLFHFSIFMGA